MNKKKSKIKVRKSGVGFEECGRGRGRSCRDWTIKIIQNAEAEQEACGHGLPVVEARVWGPVGI